MAHYNRVKTRFLLALALTGIVLFQSSCSCDREFDYSGRLVESCENPVPLVGIPVSYNWDFYDTTDQNGNFRIKGKEDPCFSCAEDFIEYKLPTDSTNMEWGGRLTLPGNDEVQMGTIYHASGMYVRVKLDFPDTLDLLPTDSIFLITGYSAYYPSQGYTYYGNLTNGEWGSVQYLDRHTVSEELYKGMHIGASLMGADSMSYYYFNTEESVGTPHYPCEEDTLDFALTYQSR